MKKTLVLLLFILSSLLLMGQGMRYSRVRILADKSDIFQITSLGINLDNSFFTNGYITAELSEHDLEKLSANKLQYDVLIEDMTAYYAGRNLLPESRIDLHTGTQLSKNFLVPQGFSLGSLGGFSNYDECMEHLDNMFANYPCLITPRQAIGPLMTQEGRPVYFVTLTNQNQRTDKAKVLYTGLIHAREPVSMQHLLYFMYYLLENYESDPQINYLLNYAELYFVPMLNPDGYLYNEQIAPNGGGMWRKNRRINEDGSFGVDLNRNFGYKWGYDNTGSSPVPTSDIYRGPEPFSEPEAALIKQLCEEITFSIALNYHSYSNLLLFPWGYIKTGTPDNDLYETHASLMTSESGYIIGQSSVILYLNNGGTDDWMYGDQTSKPKIFAYTPEVGTSSDGFWPAINRIIPLCQENMFQSLTAGLLSLHYGVVSDNNPAYLSHSQGYLGFQLQRMGLEDGGSFTISLEPISEWILETGNEVQHFNLLLSETITDSIYYILDPSTPYGAEIKFVLLLDNGHFIIHDTISKMFGTPEIVFFDDCSNLDNWTGTWGITNDTYVSPPTSIADSPHGDYSNNAYTYITTINPVDLSNVVWAELSFWAKWDIEAGWDYVQVKTSANNGETWTPLNGKYTKPGSSYQAPGQPLYDGNQPEWIREEIDLSEFSGESLLFRFTLVSNFWITGEGFYFDDFTVTIIPYLDVPAALFNAETNVLLEGSQVQFLDLSSGNPDSWHWQFEGGAPVSSNLQNPLVHYAIPGSYNVSLIASNENGSDSLEIMDYILVLDSILCRPQVFAGNDSIILPGEPFTALQAQAFNYKSLIWTTSGDGIFDNDTILYTTYNPGNEDIQQQHVYLTLKAHPHYDVCSTASHTLGLSIVDYTGTVVAESHAFGVYPNPAGNTVYIDFSERISSAKLEIINLPGKMILTHAIENTRIHQLDLTGIPKGIYFIRLTNDKGVAVQKIVVIK